MSDVSKEIMVPCVIERRVQEFEELLDRVMLDIVRRQDKCFEERNAVLGCLRKFANDLFTHGMHIGRHRTFEAIEELRNKMQDDSRHRALFRLDECGAELKADGHHARCFLSRGHDPSRRHVGMGYSHDSVYAWHDDGSCDGWTWEDEPK